MATAAGQAPRATYRLQLGEDLDFRAAGRLAPYLETLGVSHAYLSPILAARPTSAHGYDTTDHSRLDPRLGTIEDFRAMAARFRSHGIGIIVDFVPNHMGVGGADNLYWLDVLEWGERSRFAGWFDIDWHPATPTLESKVLVPVLGVGYGEALVGGALRVRADVAAGTLSVWAHEHHRLPLTPPSYGFVLSGAHPALDALARDFSSLAERGDAVEAAEALKGRLAETLANEPEATRELEARICELNGRDGEPAGKRRLDALIATQHWRVAWHEVADEEINYRRFFAVSDLAAIRIEEPAVFEAAHRLVFSLIGEGLIEGLRIDHVDGLHDPEAYCTRLREAAPRPIYLVVEKILAPGERLRSGWRVDGTTGYEFGSLVTRLLVDPEGENELTRLHAEFTGGRPEFAAIERDCKCLVLDSELSAELEALAVRLCDLADTSIFTRDITRRQIRHALRAFIVALPVYRTYVSGRGTAPEDLAVIGQALEVARRKTPRIGAAVWRFLGDALTGDGGVDDGPEECAGRAVEAAMRVQQLTGAVMAKGLEDTALYRYNRLIAVNDVGARPDRPTATIREFHEANAERAERFPGSMLGTSSHDAKRGEDTRARIAALSGHVSDWRERVMLWRQILARRGAPEIDPDELYYFFQMLFGARPVGEDRDDSAALARFAERLDAAMLKSVREARLHSSWRRRNETYETQVGRLVATALAPEAENALAQDLEAFERRVGRDGALNALIATALKLTMPGVPDIYQGAEAWEQSMVDPDNRRPVDFGGLEALISQSPVALGELMDHWRDGAVKQALIARLLRLRRLEAALFAEGDYQPVEAGGRDGSRVVAFLRRRASKALLVAVRLYPWRDGEEVDPLHPDLPPGLPADGWHDALATPPAGDDQRAGPPIWAGSLPISVSTNFVLAG